MKALLRKDAYILLKNARTLLLMLAVMGAVFISGGGGEAFVVVAILLFAMMVITCMSIDETSKWNRYALVMPLRRRDIVREKYLLLTMLCLLGTLLGLLVTVSLGLLRGSLQWGPLGLVTLVGLCVALLSGGVMIPVLYKFGAEKARMLLMLFYLVPTGIVLLSRVVLRGRSFEVSGALLRALPWAAPVAVLAVMALSYRISLRVFGRKEL